MLLFKYGIDNWNWYFVLVTAIGIIEVDLELLFVIGV